MTKGRRGRPTKYDRDRALEKASDLFWSAGFSGTSLDALSEATDMMRPSLAGAFGNKEGIYIAVLERYRDTGLAELASALSGLQPLNAELTNVFRTATDLYASSANAARGCLLIGTASVEAVQRPRVRSILQEGLASTNRLIEQRIEAAITSGELKSDCDPVALASITSAILHSLAVRARAGEKREALDSLCRTAVELIVGK